MDSDIKGVFKQNIHNYNTLLSKFKFTNYLDYEDSKLHTIKNKIFRTSWWLLRFMRKTINLLRKKK